MLRAVEAVAVVTAAGASTRMGRPKALLGWGGKPLLQHQMDALRDWGRVIVVLGHEATSIQATVSLPANVRVIVHPAYALGRSSSLAAGFAAIPPGPAAILVAGVDQPLDTEVLAMLLDAMDSHAVCVPTCQGHRGHPVLLAGRLLGELQAVQHEPEGLRTIVRRHAASCREVAVPGSFPLLDLNTPEAYTRACIAHRPRWS